MRNRLKITALIFVLATLSILSLGFKVIEIKKGTPPKKQTLVLSTKLKMPTGTGTNGAAVAFDSKLGNYYAVLAGNMLYPLSMFNKRGQPLDTFSEANFDVRGLWYNPQSGNLEGNGYGDEELIILIRHKVGTPCSTETSGTLIAPPDYNSVACYDTSGDEIVFYNSGALYFYDHEFGDENRVIEIDPSIIIANINITTCVYTGIAGAEFGLLDFVAKRILLLDSDGRLTKSIALPPKAPVNQSFNFSYSNGHFWLFDIKSRTWMGYILK